MGHVVVTGAAGFIGGHLVRRLLADGHEVVGIDRRDRDLGAARLVVAELSRPDGAADAALRGARAVYHLAGCPGVRRRGAAVQARRRRDNIVAGARVLRLIPPGVPVVVASSSSVYGSARRPAGGGQGGIRACRESDLPRPRGGYARSKLALERLCQARVARGGRVAVARPFTVAGPGQRPDMAIASWLADLRAGRPLTVLGSPDRVRDITDVRDVVEGLVRLADVPEPTTVNLGGGRGWSLGEVVAACGAALGRRPEIVLAPAHRDEAEATLADTTRCRRLLGFTPTTRLPELIARQARSAPALAQPA